MEIFNIIWKFINLYISYRVLLSCKKKKEKIRNDE